MFTKSSWLHLRIPFSYFLMPVFLFALCVSPNFTGSSLFWSFVIIHLFLYPASNGYNSYFDKDEKSIGGLKNPPPVNTGLYWLSIAFDFIAVALALVNINITFAVMVLIYGIISKAYSHPAVRLKKYAIASWIIIGLFQGCFTFLMCYAGINKFGLENLLKPALLAGGALTTVMLWANYPMTQIYQHEEDQKRGDNTLSRVLGVKGTFLFTGILFLVVTIGFISYFNAFFAFRYALAFLLFLFPVVAYFSYWFLRVLKEVSLADYTHAMWLNFISATSLNAFFIYAFLDYTKLLDAFR